MNGKNIHAPWFPIPVQFCFIRSGYFVRGKMLTPKTPVQCFFQSTPSHLEAGHIADFTVSRRCWVRCFNGSGVVWMQGCGRSLDFRNNGRTPRLPFLELLGVIGDRFRDMRYPNRELQAKPRLSSVFIRGVEGW